MPPQLTFNTTIDFEYGVPAPVAPGIARIVAQNPTPLTYTGTNTYLVGMTELAVIDPGPADPGHVAAIIAAAAGRPITHIFVTHAHRDHVDAAPMLQHETGAPIYGYGRRTKPLDGAQINPSGKEFVDYAFEPDHVIGDGNMVSAREWRLTALHTPGHAPDHLCFALHGRKVLFSGDHVMAWNTTLVAPPEGSMGDYTASLERLLSRTETLYLPGHGGRIRDPARTIRAYLLHRRWREQLVLEAIRAGGQTVPGIVPVVYPAMPDNLTTAAELSVLAHVEHLIARGLVACDGSLPAHHRLSAV